MESENVALFDMDGTLCDLRGQLRKDMDALRDPEEREFTGNIEVLKFAPPHVQKRADMIKSSPEWWANLPKLPLGFDVLRSAQDLGYKIMVLTKGSRRYPASWEGKKLWVDRQLGSGVKLTITEDKGLVYGKALVDDFPPYIDGWLKWRSRGLVILPDNDKNRDYGHPQVLRYDGSNLDEVRAALEQRLHGPTDLSQISRGGQEARLRVR